MYDVPLDTSLGYALKRVTTALRAQLDARLRLLDLTVSQYACLEVLTQRPGISNAELARGVFVSRQATHQLLAGLTGEGLVERRGEGREQRLHVTARGAELLAAASREVAAVEARMVDHLGPAERRRLLADLDGFVTALTAGSDDDV